MTLDELVATRVMKWTADADGLYATSTAAHGGRVRYCVPDSDAMDSVNDAEPWSPTTNIAHAWEVVEKMRSMGWWWSLSSFGGEKGDWRFDVMMDHKSDPEETRQCVWAAKTAPLAITLAALRACGVTEGEIEAAQEPQQ